MTKGKFDLAGTITHKAPRRAGRLRARRRATSVLVTVNGYRSTTQDVAGAAEPRGHGGQGRGQVAGQRRQEHRDLPSMTDDPSTETPGRRRRAGAPDAAGPTPARRPGRGRPPAGRAASAARPAPAARRRAARRPARRRGRPGRRRADDRRAGRRRPACPTPGDGRDGGRRRDPDDDAAAPGRGRRRRACRPGSPGLRRPCSPPARRDGRPARGRSATACGGATIRTPAAGLDGQPDAGADARRGQDLPRGHEHLQVHRSRRLRDEALGLHDRAADQPAPQHHRHADQKNAPKLKATQTAQINRAGIESVSRTASSGRSCSSGS